MPGRSNQHLRDHPGPKSTNGIKKEEQDEWLRKEGVLKNMALINIKRRGTVRQKRKQKAKVPETGVEASKYFAFDGRRGKEEKRGVSCRQHGATTALVKGGDAVLGRTKSSSTMRGEGAVGSRAKGEEPANVGGGG